MAREGPMPLQDATFPRQVSLGGEARGQLSPRLHKQTLPVDIPKMQMSNVINRSAPRTSWVIASS
jgi:hypothetical protein